MGCICDENRNKNPNSKNKIIKGKNPKNKNKELNETGIEEINDNNMSDNIKKENIGKDEKIITENDKNKIEKKESNKLNKKNTKKNLKNGNIENEIKSEKEDTDNKDIEKNRIIEKDKIDKEKSEKERVEKDKIEKLKIEKERLEKIKFENEKKEKEKLMKEMQEKQRLEKERIEKERIQKLEKEKIEKEKLEKERLEKERIERERIEKERIEKEKLEKIRLEKERLELEKIQKERLEKERIEKERIEKERIEKEKLEKERIEKERIEKERIEKERIEKERIEKERIEKERIEKERLEKELIERQRILDEMLDKIKKEKEKVLKELKEKEKKLKEEMDNKKTLELEEIEKKKKENLELSQKFQEIQKVVTAHVNNANSQKNFCENFKSFMDEFVTDINDINSKIHISVIDIDENFNQQNKTKIQNDINKLYSKFNNFISILEKIENEHLKTIEKKFGIIQENLNDAKNLFHNSNPNLKALLSIKNNIIKKNLDDLNKIIIKLREDEISYENLKKEIENDIKDLQNKGKKFCEEAEKKEIESARKIKEEAKIKQDIIKNAKENYPNIGKMFLKNSMLLGIDDFANSNDLFSSKILFRDNNIDIYKKDLLRRNWKETCYVYQDYDLYDITFELKAVGLKSNCYYNQASIGLTLNRTYKILEFEIDGKKSPYHYSNSLIEFDIHLNNLESNQIHVKYQESENLTKLEKKERKLYRNDWYGISKNLKGQNAIFTLIIKCDYEIIGFEKGFLAKIKDKQNEYRWAGKVPDEGTKILVKMSRKTAKFDFNIVEGIESINNEPLKNTTLSLNSYFMGGNLEISNLKIYSNQTKQIEHDSKNGKYIIKFIDTNSYYGEFNLEGKLTNRCKGEWKCDLTKEQIEKEYPDDFKYNKEGFKKIALDIIKNYDIKHSKDPIKVTDLVKIGEWVKDNIKYDLSYEGKNEISATEVYNIGAGVCHHFTKLYNALLYSLGYECIYVSGFAIKKNDCFNDSDRHAWSLIKVNDKWLPFDATWGIFSGKLPVCHIFEHYFIGGKNTSGFDIIKFKDTKVKGTFIE